MKINVFKTVILTSICLLGLTAFLLAYLIFFSGIDDTLSDLISEDETVLLPDKIQTPFNWIGYEIPEADVDSFRVINNEYAIDKNNVYYKYAVDNYTVFKNIDTAGFEYVGTDFWSVEYIKNNNFVYFKEPRINSTPEVVDGADPETFIVPMDHVFTGQDKNHSYVQDQIVDLDTFKELNSVPFAKDAFHVYTTFGLGTMWNVVLEGINAESFSSIDGYYATDSNKIIGPCYAYEWSCLAAIDQADADTFEIIEAPFSKDADNVYFFENVIAEADPNTFKKLNVETGLEGRFYIDINALYYTDPMNEFRIDNFDISTINIEVGEQDDNSITFFVTDKYGEYQMLFLATSNHTLIGASYRYEISNNGKYLFNSVRDVGIGPNVSFQHPSNWIYFGSIDGGTGSMILFYDKDDYAQTCQEALDGGTSCTIEGMVALLKFSTRNAILPEIDYLGRVSSFINQDGFSAEKITGDTSQLIIRNQDEQSVGFYRFDFTMTTEDEASKELFNEIIKTIDFNPQI
ncbi:DKNYY domain-containing protein [Patescibacteria group bacterium]|nr:DKNYY domain-containing protein [Patescibacteria group bacterium]MCG2687378.1 DKNYY domain-containing protein [Candidatus Parcubacteria bacterium]